MTKSVKLFYHDGFYSRNPIKTVSNIARFGTFHHRVYNLGDQLSPVIVSGLAGNPAKYVAPSTKKKLIAIGSILAAVQPGDTIWGAGLKVENHIQHVKKFSGRFSVRAVRGPETQKVLVDNGIECPEIYGDPGLLLPIIYPKKLTKKYRIGLVPHIHQIEDFRKLELNEDCLLISPTQEWEGFINNLCSCEYVISSSLHGIILAEAYGIPVIPMIHQGFVSNSSFKYLDYYHSTNREPHFLDSKYVLDKVNGGYIENLADEIGKPTFNLEPLLRAFPYFASEQDLSDKLKKLNLLEITNVTSN